MDRRISGVPEPGPDPLRANNDTAPVDSSRLSLGLSDPAPSIVCMFDLLESEPELAAVLSLPREACTPAKLIDRIAFA